MCIQAWKHMHASRVYTQHTDKITYTGTGSHTGIQHWNSGAHMQTHMHTQSSGWAMADGSGMARGYWSLTCSWCSASQQAFLGHHFLTCLNIKHLPWPRHRLLYHLPVSLAVEDLWGWGGPPASAWVPSPWPWTLGPLQAQASAGWQLMCLFAWRHGGREGAKVIGTFCKQSSPGTFCCSVWVA